MTNEPIDVFIEGILKEAKLDNLPAEYKEEYISKLTAQVERRIGIIAMKELDEEGLNEFAILAKSKPSKEKVERFFTDKVPGFQEKVREGLKEFATEFITASNKQ
jgi:hypothetical protein